MLVERGEMGRRMAANGREADIGEVLQKKSKIEPRRKSHKS
jgi:hypothetical protein